MGIFNKFLIYCYFLDGICWFFLLKRLIDFVYFMIRGLCFFIKKFFFLLNEEILMFDYKILYLL